MGFTVSSDTNTSLSSTAMFISKSGDLILNNNNISASNIITANSFVGTLTGNATGLTGTPDITVGAIEATSLNVTSITSSIVTSSILQTEGSNIFGDTSTDTHTFNGSITASGNISASGTGTHTFGGNVKILGLVTDLPSSAQLRWGSGDAEIREGLDDNYSLSLRTYDGSGLSTALKLYGDNVAEFSGNITASGNISSSGTGNNIFGGDILLDGDRAITDIRV